MVYQNINVSLSKNVKQKNSMGFELLNIKKWKLQNGSNIHLTTFVPASEWFRRVHNAF
jgi:hypothetical protein